MAIRVGIVGGSGYGGGELVRLLLFHPEVEIAWVAAHEQAGRLVADVHPNLRRLAEFRFLPSPTADTIGSLAEGLDCIFLALPHGRSMELVPRIPESTKVIDLAGDFRLKDPEAFETHYGRLHSAQEHLERFVYGLTELQREEIARATRVANPGCFATAVLLGLAPFVSARLLVGPAIADAKTGSSGAGAKPLETTHHPRRANSFFAYKPFAHQHLPEIAQALARLEDDRWSERLILQVHSAPVVRGIFASLYLTLAEPMTAEEIGDLFHRFYADAFFVRLLGPNVSPDITWVKHTNFCDIGWAVRGRTAIVFTAIDNLVKGAAGQAVQNMNVMFGLDETLGLKWPGSHP
ncbi:MAG: N-acetyl-gamma-glutamyl-phosphate reductase [Blastocatellia bacterium]|nr:N-acetyl-gamma-glutamyl-phosphate reductase [Blastocatellia bacterium]MCS7157205.1 N-acetyl-gamma-glutamyl-phosphate reductase [Blastocatellia bacterium]MCX7752332.1 N-acetyl-gamma-glutamyl-phosphate reductase [Blastocatellia bacterium]MDW8167213.1 N-acetyl-gamma-glutamyl-phosphate reductase [Acidobacteriota bacterium]